MKEFIENYKNDNLYILENNKYVRQISIYLNSPSWRTRGFVEDVDYSNNQLIMHIEDLLYPVSVRINSEIPQWLLEYGDTVVCFIYKIHQGWRSLNSYEGLDWSKVWKTFKFDGHITKVDKENFSLL